jgi:hypothetical protein
MNKKISTIGFLIVWILSAISIGIIFLNQNDKNDSIANFNKKEASFFYEKKVFTRHTKRDFEIEDVASNNTKIVLLKEKALNITKKTIKIIEKPKLENSDGFDIRPIPTN